MTPHKQTVLYGKQSIGNGNCLATCVASILDLPIWMVPPFEQMFAHEEPHTSRLKQWLHRFFNLDLRWTEDLNDPELPEFYIACGPTPRGTKHACIYSKGVLVSDPHYSNEGLVKVDYAYYFAPREP